MPHDLPDYAADPLRRFLECWEACDRLVRMSMQGISMLRGVPRIIEVLEKVQPSIESANEALATATDSGRVLSRLEKARAQAEFAQEECDNGFPLLHAHTLMGLWGSFEAAIEDMVVGILSNEPELLKRSVIGKVRMSVAEYETLEKDERMRAVLGEIQRNLGSGVKEGGLGTFEGVLEKIGLAGPVPADLAKTMWEIQNVRNCLVHRSGVADRRLITNCPWLNLRIGDSVVVKHDTLSAYSAGMCEYVVVLARRLGDRYGVDIQARIDAVEKKRGSDGTLDNTAIAL
jgi:hypothetical protein